MQQNFDSRALLRGTFDFVTCQRTDGSFYGNGGAACRKGVEATLPTELVGRLSPRTEALCSAQADTILAASGELPETMAPKINDFLEKKEAALERIKNGDVTEAEVKSFILDHEQFDIAQSEFVVIGQERRTTEGADNQAEYLAQAFAQKAMVDEGMSLKEASQVARTVDAARENEAGAVLRSNSFIGVSSNTAQQVLAEGSPQIRDRLGLTEAFYGGGKMSSIEMSNVGAIGTQDGNKGSGGKVDLARSEYGHLKTSRGEVARKYGDARAEKVKSTIQDAAKNGKLKGAMAMPGGGGKYTTFQKEVVDKFWNGKSGAESNIREVSVPLKTTGAAAKERNITSHVVDLGGGKYMTSHALTFVTQGYQSGSKIAELRREAIKRAAGSDKGYTPKAAPKARGSIKVPKAAPKPTAPTRTGPAQAKMDLRRRIQKAKRDGRDTDVARLEKSLKELK